MTSQWRNYRIACDQARAQCQPTWDGSVACLGRCDRREWRGGGQSDGQRHCSGSFVSLHGHYWWPHTALCGHLWWAATSSAVGEQRGSGKVIWNHCPASSWVVVSCNCEIVTLHGQQLTGYDCLTQLAARDVCSRPSQAEIIDKQHTGGAVTCATSA